MKTKLKSLVSKDNGVGRTVRTWLQAFIGILAFVYGVVVIPDFQNFLVSNNIVAVGTLASFVAAVTALHNGAEKLLSFLFGEEA